MARTAGPVGYCTPSSVLPGDTVTLHAAGGEGTIDVDVVRDGLRPETVWRSADVRVSGAPVPDDAPERGCRWDATITIPAGDWRSGLYLVRFDGHPQAWFVVRAPRPSADRALLVLATNTWNAYNDFGGRNLYTGAVVVSFERPLPAGFLDKPDDRRARVIQGRGYEEFTRSEGLGDWHGMAGWAGQERRFVAWTEQQGLRLDYATNVDLERVPGLLDGYGLYVSVGHDEYWSWEMRDAVEAFVGNGGRAAFFSGNTCYWQVRNEGGAMVCFKHRFTEDPVRVSERARLTTTMWSDPIIARPETEMTGLSFTRGGYSRTFRSVRRGSGAYEVHRADHWLLAGTRLGRGDLLGAADVVVGYECDGCDLTLLDGLPVVTGRGGTPADFAVVATAPAIPFDEHSTPLPLAPGGEYELEFHARRLFGDASPANCERLRHGHAVLGAHRDGAVVAVGCTDWAYGLGDPAIARVTRNVFAAAGIAIDVRSTS